jgi:hypothetical protein
MVAISSWFAVIGSPNHGVIGGAMRAHVVMSAVCGRDLLGVSDLAPPLSNTSPLIHRMNRPGVVDGREGLTAPSPRSATPPAGDSRRQQDRVSSLRDS